MGADVGETDRRLFIPEILSAGIGDHFSFVNAGRVQAQEVAGQFFARHHVDMGGRIAREEEMGIEGERVRVGRVGRDVEVEVVVEGDAGSRGLGAPFSLSGEIEDVVFEGGVDGCAAIAENLDVQVFADVVGVVVDVNVRGFFFGNRSRRNRFRPGR